MPYPMRLAQCTLRPLALIAILLGSGTHASTGWDAALYVDGKVRTDGVDFQGTSVLVERNGIITQFITKDIERLRLRFDLQYVYVLTFEHAGCLTKKLRFDTHVPADKVALAPFNFPFKLTLVKTEKEMGREYAGPVGSIRFFVGRDDFYYDTDFSLKQVQEAGVAIEPDSWSDGIPAQDSGAAHNDSSTETHEPRANTATNEQTEPHERVGSVEADMDVQRANAVEAPSFIHASSASETLSHTRTMTMAKASNGTVTPSYKFRPAIRTVNPAPGPPSVVLPDGRTEELVVEGSRVTTIVRITESGHTREFRRVAHRYGQVYYFSNGASCSELTYHVGVDTP